jgi:Ca2+-binding RTX toxin-like protein
MTFTVNSGTYTVNNLELRALQDNFDFQSSNPIASTANVLLNKALDPYGLIPVVGSNTVPVDILYTGSGRQYTTYSKANFDTDQGLVDGWTSPLNLPIATANFAAALAGLATNTGYLGAINADRYFRYYTPDGKKVIYGTPDDDNLTVLSAEVTLDVYFAHQMVGGDGNDQITGGTFGDELWGGPGNDTLNGGLGDDTFIGGPGNDTMDGGSFIFGSFQGTDSSVYKGALSEYDIEFLPNDTVRITDKVAGRDGIDTLKGVDIGVFSDKSIKLSPGQDIAFVIDTTGSMWDDIDAVKARSNDIITAIFDGERSVLDSHIAVVGYNDPGTNTFLSFTEQPKIADRKTAASNAINSISVGGGGDFPELVNSGLLRALNGGAGEWREEAIARRIILFGDAPPKDTELRAQVLALAADVGVSVPSSPSSLSIAGDIETTTITEGLALTSFALTTVNAAGEEVTVPVQIFTVLIGNDPTTQADFASLAEATGGQSFNAANASEVVDALIAAIETPINGNPIAANDTATTQQELSVNVAVLDNDSDPDGDTLAITSFTDGINGLVTLNDNSTPDNTADDFLVYTPNPQSDPTLGFSDTFEYTISDGNGGTDTAIVNISINPPVVEVLPINDQSIQEDTAFSFTLPSDIFTSPSGSPLTYQANLGKRSELPSWLTFNSQTLTFSGTPPADYVGSFEIYVTATDESGATAQDSFTLTVENVNDPPYLNKPIANQTAPEDAAFIFALPASTFDDDDLDSPGDILRYKATLIDGSKLPAWLTFDKTTATFSGTPGNSDVGVIQIKVTATDGYDTSAEDTFELKVVNTNDAPTLVKPIANQTVNSNSAFIIPEDTFNDIDAGDSLTYQAFLGDGGKLPDWIDFDSKTSTISYTPTDSNVGTTQIKVVATDKAGATAESKFDLVVTNLNHAPTVGNPIPAQTTAEDEVYSFAIPENTFLDGDSGDSLSYSVKLADGTDLPSWLSFEGNTLGGIPENGNVGEYSLEITASDKAGASVSTPLELTVTNTNDAPIVATPIPAQVAVETQPFSFALPEGTFTDEDAGDVLSYQVTLSNGEDLPSWLTLNPEELTLTGTPGDEDAGLLSLEIEATDGAGLSAQTPLTLLVRNFISGTEGNDILQGTVGSDFISGGDGKDQLIGFYGNDVLDGGAKGDYLSGQKGNDFLNGGLGNDVLIGGFGKDTHTGGIGRDQIIFNKPQEGADTITDFKSGRDSIGLSLGGFSVEATEGQVQSGQFVLGATAQDGDDYLLYNSATGELFFDSDGAGNAQAKLLAKLTPGTMLESIDLYWFG